MLFLIINLVGVWVGQCKHTTSTFISVSSSASRSVASSDPFARLGLEGRPLKVN